jgi:hypothetical protein
LMTNVGAVAESIAGAVVIFAATGALLSSE